MSEFQIYTRTENGGYGPKDIQMLLDSVPVYQGQSSSKLVDWAEVVPSSLSIVSKLPDLYVRSALFPAQAAATYYRLRFVLPPES